MAIVAIATYLSTRELSYRYRMILVCEAGGDGVKEELRAYFSEQTSADVWEFTMPSRLGGGLQCANGYSYSLRDLSALSADFDFSSVENFSDIESIFGPASNVSLAYKNRAYAVWRVYDGTGRNGVRGVPYVVYSIHDYDYNDRFGKIRTALVLGFFVFRGEQE